MRHINAGRLALLLITATAGLYSLLMASALLLARPDFQIQFVPDDTFYYLTLARNFSLLGHWTFDSGVSVTTGFHPLHAYFLSALYRLLHPAPDDFLKWAMMFSYLVFLTVFTAASMFVFRALRLFPALLLFLFVLSRNVMLNAISAVEWPWVVLFSTLYSALFFARGRNKRAGIFLCGFLGSFARTDFGLMPAAFLFSALLFAPGSGRREFIVFAFMGLLGAFSGVLADCLQNIAISGTLWQSSAMMKSVWGRFDKPSVKFLTVILLKLFGDLSWLTIILTGLTLLFTFLLGALIFLKRAFTGEEDSVQRSRILWFGSVMTVLGYAILYYRNSAGLQNWYSANFIVPLFLAMSLPIIHSRPKHLFSLVALILLLLLCVRQTFIGLYFLKIPEWPHQAYMRNAGEFLKEKKLTSRIGSWNAGIIGFYDEGKIINIDGLVNNDIYRYARENRLPEYIDSKSIRYIVDTDVMFTSDFRRKGGYDRPDFLARLRPIVVFDRTTSFWRHLTLYQVEK